MTTPHEREDRDRWSEKAPFWDLHIGDDGDRNRRLHVDPVIWRMLGDVRGLSVLDAGCGTGYLSVQLARRGARVTAVDYAPGMVEQARKRAKRLGVAIELGLDNCCSLATIAPASQDRVVSNYVLQDLEDMPAALRAFARALKPGGVAVLVFVHPCFGIPGGPDREGDTITYAWPFSYFDERRLEETWQGTRHDTREKFDFPSRFTFYHRPLSSYWRAFTQAGFTCLELDEPVVQPPYPPELSEDEIERFTRCSWSIAFKLRATAPARDTETRSTVSDPASG